MIILLSPAKALDFESKPHVKAFSSPLFVQQAQELILLLRQQSPSEIANLMSLSDKLAALNVGRYAAWTPEVSLANAKQAILAFDGDVYTGLNAKSLNEQQLDWAQDCVRILSGLYGVLRPLDLMQPYRLEMGTAFQTASGPNLYRFWGDRIAQYLNAALQDSEHSAEKVILNLASQEYFKSVDTKALAFPVVEGVFEERKEQGYKVIGFFAKKARGLMARYAIENRIEKVENIKNFDKEGYRFAPEVSTERRFVFRRDANA
jgi:hypothetical protein